MLIQLLEGLRCPVLEIFFFPLKIFGGGAAGGSALWSLFFVHQFSLGVRGLGRVLVFLPRCPAFRSTSPRRRV